MENVISYEKSEEFGSGTSLQGYVTTTYDHIVSILGKPTYTDGDPYEKVNCEWVIDVKAKDEWDEDDWTYETVTIYNWKTGYTPTEEYQWHVGGNNFRAQDLVEEILLLTSNQE